MEYSLLGLVGSQPTFYRTVTFFHLNKRSHFDFCFNETHNSYGSSSYLLLCDNKNYYVTHLNVRGNVSSGNRVVVSGFLGKLNYFSSDYHSRTVPYMDFYYLLLFNEQCRSSSPFEVFDWPSTTQVHNGLAESFKD